MYGQPQRRIFEIGFETVRLRQERLSLGNPAGYGELGNAGGVVEIRRALTVDDACSLGVKT